MHLSTCLDFEDVLHSLLAMTGVLEVRFVQEWTYRAEERSPTSQSLDKERKKPVEGLGCVHLLLQTTLWRESVHISIRSIGCKITCHRYTRQAVSTSKVECALAWGSSEWKNHVTFPGFADGNPIRGSRCQARDRYSCPSLPDGSVFSGIFDGPSFLLYASL